MANNSQMLCFYRTVKYVKQHVSVLPTYMCLCFLISIPTASFGSKIDSVKHVLANTQNPSEECRLGFYVYSQYLSGGNTDTIVKYGLETISYCDVNDKEEIKWVNVLLADFLKLGLDSMVNERVDSLANQISDVNDRLIFFSTITEFNIFFNPNQDSYKYWEKANDLIPYVTDDNAFSTYYGVSGYKNETIGNYISAFQSYSLASSYANVDHYTELRTKTKLSNTENEEYEIVVFCYYNMMELYFLTNKYEELIDLCHQAIEAHEQYSYDNAKGYTYYMLGLGHLNIANMNSAYYYFTKGVEVSIDNNDDKELKDNYDGIGDYHAAIGDYKKSNEFYEKALNIEAYADRHKNDKLIKKIAKLCMLQGDYKIAYYNLEKYSDNQAAEKLKSNSDIKVAFSIIEDAYDYRQQAEQRLLEKEMQQVPLRRIVFTVITLLAIGSLAFFFLYENRKRLKMLNDKISASNVEMNIRTNKQKETIKYLENFAYVAAHDLKAPIRTATSFAEILSTSSTSKLDEKELSLLGYIDSSVGKLSQMIDDLLSLSKLDVDLPDEEDIDLNDIVDRLKISLGSLINESDAIITAMSQLPIVKGHPSLITQLFQNIIKNAINHNRSNDRPIIKISAKKKDDHWYVISIKDYSGGIAEYLMPTLFDLFSTSDKNKGNGIGLATCKKIVKHYGGDIWVDVEVGIGSTFNFTLQY